MGRTDAAEKINRIVGSYTEINKEIPLLVIAGPTAIGKNSIALELSDRISSTTDRIPYVINADSRQVYKELPISTAQPIPDKVKGGHWIINGIEHCLYGYKSIFDSYTLYDYQRDVTTLIDKKRDINSRSLPILVGGTGLFIDSVVLNYKLEKEPPTSGPLNMPVEQMQEKLGEKLKQLNRSDKSNPHRLARLLARGGKMYEKGTPVPHIYFVLMPESKERLFEKIKIRIDTMFDQGLEQEYQRVKDLVESSNKKKLGRFNPLKTIGYQEFELGLNNTEEVKEQIYVNSCKYAKRQLTWFKKVKSGNYEFIIAN